MSQPKKETVVFTIIAFFLINIFVPLFLLGPVMWFWATIFFLLTSIVVSFGCDHPMFKKFINFTSSMLIAIIAVFSAFPAMKFLSLYSQADWAIKIWLVAIYLFVAILTGCIFQISPLLGTLLRRIGTDNNYRFYVLVLCTMVALFLAIKNGGGEPIATAVFRDNINWFKQTFYSEKAQKIKNSILAGVHINDEEMKQKKDWLKQYKSKAEYAVRSEKLPDENLKEYTEKANNQLVYGLFTTDVEISKLIAEASPTIANNAKKPLREGTWLYWKIFFIFLIMTLIYTPFAFADEVAGVLDYYAEKIKSMLDKREQTQEAASTPATTANTSNRNFLNRIGEIGMVDVSMELIYKILKMSAEYLKKNA